ncbi:hypothetical protein TTHERM_000939240 (macronuclear) [Tetrahymena thermophila SB210]|uniref:Uncharacterized protein n=1 Tax=Tetrahymena thermophila (strain SB210) TaxID=312017 RepID=W7X7H8_TETTS|nr:hypothetical protein TTHERM_000939240 [Tetrahymena thermophila SB210]EWS72333.1 hypothetical protein TTHERM_000939240 [Tetrahymena thermophila SB210]|eukprot:XP_012655141.1 hypothetical protein TTHERM_000939240 [Tetrahymena thermophila SB210]
MLISNIHYKIYFSLEQLKSIYKIQTYNQILQNFFKNLFASQSNQQQIFHKIYEKNVKYQNIIFDIFLLVKKFNRYTYKQQYIMIITKNDAKYHKNYLKIIFTYLSIQYKIILNMSMVNYGNNIHQSQSIMVITNKGLTYLKIFFLYNSQFLYERIYNRGFFRSVGRKNLSATLFFRLPSIFLGATFKHFLKNIFNKFLKFNIKKFFQLLYILDFILFVSIQNFD